MIYITISSSIRGKDKTFSPINAIFFNNSQTEICTENEDNPWFCYDFLYYKVNITHYQIRSANNQMNLEHPRSWVIERSNDKKEWVVLDEQNDCAYLNCCCLIHAFKIQLKSHLDLFE